ncbi:putative aliphatic sulfonates transport permease protein SsuC [compost metagenome]
MPNAGEPAGIPASRGGAVHCSVPGRGRAAIIRLRRAAEKSVVMLAVVLLWEALPRLGLVDPFLLPPFSEAVASLFHLFLTGEMFRHIAKSLERSGLAFAAAAVFSIPVGAFMGWNKRIERIIDPLIQACRNTSTLALYPVFILFFGLGEASKVAIIIWGTIWPILLNTISGVKECDPLLIKAARSMGVPGSSLFRRVIIPMALPSILTGLRLGAANAILMLVAAEMLGADRGLGFMIFYYQERYAIPEMFGGIIFISVLGVLINYGLVKLEKSLTRWKEGAVKG